MKTLKAIFLLSSLALFWGSRETEAQVVIKPEWSKLAKCSHLLIEAVSHLARSTVPTIVEMNTCTGYVVASPPKGSRYLLWYARVTLEFIKKVTVDKSECLLRLLNKVSGTLAPYVKQIRTVGCLDEDDFFL